jgi:hypothetical protein
MSRIRSAFANSDRAEQPTAIAPLDRIGREAVRARPTIDRRRLSLDELALQCRRNERGRTHHLRQCSALETLGFNDDDTGRTPCSANT